MKKYKYRVKYRSIGGFTRFNGIWHPLTEEWHAQYKFTGVLAFLFPFWMNVLKNKCYTNRDSAEAGCKIHSRGEMKKELKNGDIFPVNI